MQEVPTYSINLSHNQLQKLPDQLSSLADLKVLDVRYKVLACCVSTPWGDLEYCPFCIMSLILPDDPQKDLPRMLCVV